MMISKTKLINKILKISWPLIGIFGMFILIVAVNSYRQSGLQPWHYKKLPPDNLTSTSFSSFEEYLSAEREYLGIIYNSMAADSTQGFISYTEDAVLPPIINGENQNESFVFKPQGTVFKGGVLLVHGLSDSPYIMRGIGEFLSREGYYVLGLRLPGHGTIPAALVDIHWQDWYKAVEFASEFVTQEIKKQGMGIFVMGGFSTGAALNLHYTLEHIIDSTDDIPDKLLFFSPAFGITPFARFSNMHKIVSWIPLFKKLKWQSIEPEYDPFRYTSWPYNSGYQIYTLARKNWKLVNKISSRPDYLNEMPPMISFQSRVDATVIPEKVYKLYDKIAPVDSLLFLFDVNRRYESIISGDVLDWSPEEVHGKRVKKMIRMIPEDNIWPQSIYAISHLSVPISPADSIYGDDSLIGGMNIKGERAVLDTGITLDRLRYNPFFPDMEDDVLEFLSQ